MTIGGSSKSGECALQRQRGLRESISADDASLHSRRDDLLSYNGSCSDLHRVVGFCCGVVVR